jgi:hypothetical protein
MHAKKIVTAIIAVLALTAGAFVLNAQTPAASGAASTSPANDDNAPYYTCMMHPNVHLYAPGKCPICGDPLILMSPVHVNPVVVGAVVLGMVGAVGFMVKKIFFEKRSGVVPITPTGK